jgi:hypothetical protein
MDGFPVRGSLPGLKPHIVTMEGTGASAPTLLYGKGVALTRTSEGLYKCTWTDNPGLFVGWTPGLGAATPSAVSGYGLSRDTYDTATYSIEFLLNESDFSVVDLQDNEFIDLVFWFADTSA